MSSTDRPRFSHGCPDHVEDANSYCPGGLHPVSIGDCYSQGRYRVIHKLGYRSSSTVWLARDLHEGRLVALKALRADKSSNCHELTILKYLQAADPPIPNILNMLDHFYEDGPNGTHLFIIYPFCGPSIVRTKACVLSYKSQNGLGEAREGLKSEMQELRLGDGTTRLRGDLAHKLIKHLIEAIDGLHRAGVVHGDISTDNLLFPLPSEVHQWTDAKVYEVLGDICTIRIVTEDRKPVSTLPPSVPDKFILPTNCKHMIEPPEKLNYGIVLGGFGQSFVFSGSVSGYKPSPTLITYVALEIHFENRAGFETDAWQLGCAIYETRAGRPLFPLIMYSPSLVFMQMVALLGCLPDPWWGQFEDRAWFLEDGTPKRDEQGNFYVVEETSIHKLLTSIDVEDPLERGGCKPMFETTGVRLTEREDSLLEDLLQTMLRYKPEDRINLPEVMQHPYLHWMCE